MSNALERTKQLLYEGKKSRYASEEAEAKDFADVAVGDEVSFGTNPQNGEPVRWQVLDVQDGKALLLSKYILKYQAFHDKWGIVTWETSSIRRCLNNDFLMKFFTDEERYAIVKTLVEAHENPLCNTDPGNETKDKVFLLSVVEVEKYIPVNLDRRCFDLGTVPDKRGNSKARWWWLRSPGFNEANAAIVWEDGTFSYSYIREAQGGIRPALWRSI